MLKKKTQIGDLDYIDNEELLVMVNEVLANTITLMNFTYVLSRETDQSYRVDHTTVTDKDLRGFHLK